MAEDDRWREDIERFSDRDERFRNRDERAGLRGRGGGGYGSAGRGGGRGRDHHEFGGTDRDYSRGRDYGTSSGYGTGGSAQDWRDVVGERDSSVERAFGRDEGDDYGRSYGEYWRRQYSGEDERDDGRGRERSRGPVYDYGGWGGYARNRDDFDRGWRDRGRREDDRAREGERGFFERAGDEVASWFGDEEAERRRRMDQHRGRGPKGYTRSDERIREDVSDRLTDDPHLDASDIDVRVSGGEVTLDGHVRSRADKRHAEDIAETVSGVKHVQNNLRVKEFEGAGAAGVPAGTARRGSARRGSGDILAEEGMAGLRAEAKRAYRGAKTTSGRTGARGTRKARAGTAEGGAAGETTGTRTGRARNPGGTTP
jgi:osmotically-inducible protein OsmY